MKYGKLVAYSSVAAYFFLMFPPLLTGRSCQIPSAADLMAPPAREVVITIIDNTGHPLAGAELVLDRGLRLNSDRRGQVWLDFGLKPVSLMLISVTAPGYKAQDMMLDPMDNETTIVMERKSEPSSTVSSTVSTVELNPDMQLRSESLQRRGLQEISRGEYDAAEQTFKEAYDLTPSSASICNNLAITYLRRYNFVQALQWLERGEQIAPYDPLICANLGLMRWKQDRFDESFRLLNVAAAHGFSTPYTQYILGILHLTKGHPASSSRLLEQLSAKRFPYRDLYLSLASRILGKKSEERRYFSHFLKRNPVILVNASYQSADTAGRSQSGPACP